MRQQIKDNNGSPSFLTTGSVLLAATIAGATSGPLIRLLYNGGMGMSWIIFLRVAVVILFTWPVVLARKNQRKDVFSVSKKAILMTILAAACLSGNFIFWAYSLSKETVFGSSSITTVQYLFSVIFGYLILKEKPGRGVLVSILLTFSGIIIIGWSDFKSVGDISGSILAITASVFGALYFVLSRIVRKNVSMGAYFTWLNTFSVIIAFLAVLVMNEPIKRFSLTDAAEVVALAVFCSFICHYAIAWSLKYVTADVPNLFGFSSPFFAAIFAYILLGQTVKTEVFLGAAFILAGIGFYMFMQQREKKKHREFVPREIEEIPVENNKTVDL